MNKFQTHFFLGLDIHGISTFTFLSRCVVFNIQLNANELSCILQFLEEFGGTNYSETLLFVILCLLIRKFVQNILNPFVCYRYGNCHYTESRRINH